MKFILTAVSSCLLMLLAACAASTEGIPSVQGLDIPRYMGKWYEIARMPHSFERNMDYVTADYTLNEDNTVRVVNRVSRKRFQRRRKQSRMRRRCSLRKRRRTRRVCCAREITTSCVGEK